MCSSRWPLDVLEAFEGVDQHADVVPVNGADVVEAKFLEQGAGHDHAFHVLFGAPRQLPHGGHLAQGFFAFLAHGRIKPAGQYLGQVVVHRTDVGRDGHVVVVEDDQQVGVQAAGMVHGLVRHAAGDAAVADDGDHVVVFAALELVGDGHPQGRADGSRWSAPPRRRRIRSRLRDGKAHTPPWVRMVVILSLRPVRISCAGRPGGQRPHQLVVGGVKNIMQRHRQLDSAQPRGKVPAGDAHALRQELPYFLR